MIRIVLKMLQEFRSQYFVDLSESNEGFHMMTSQKLLSNRPFPIVYFSAFEVSSEDLNILKFKGSRGKHESLIIKPMKIKTSRNT